MKITREIKTALLAISAIVLLIFGYNFLKGKNLLSNDKVFYAIYNNIEGLDVSSKVTINGYVVGKVSNIDFIGTSGKLKVTFVIEKDFEFGKKSVAKIYSAGFIGGKNLGIIPEANPTQMAKSGDEISSEIEPDLVGEVVGKLDPIQDKLKVVLDETSISLSRINKLLNEENTANISKALKSLTNTLNTLEYTSKNVDALLAGNRDNLEATLINFKNSSDNINKFSSEVSKVDVRKMMINLDETINKFSLIASKVNSNTGSVGKLVNDPAIYDNLDRATRQLDLLLQDMKLNPKRYVHFSVFGKKEKGYKKPKDSLK